MVLSRSITSWTRSALTRLPSTRSRISVISSVRQNSPKDLNSLIYP
jgi:hypothetical protein